MRVTDKTVKHFTRRFFGFIAEKYGGHITVNELRVMNLIYVYDGSASLGVARISEILDIPSSTVSRSIANLIDHGWLAKKRHPEDGRRRIIVLGAAALHSRASEVARLTRWIKEGLDTD